MFVKNNFNRTDANGWRRKAGSLVADKDLGERVYTSRLIGLVPDLIMHGGGNTSVKVTRKNIFGKDEEILHVHINNGRLSNFYTKSGKSSSKKLINRKFDLKK